MRYAICAILLCTLVGCGGESSSSPVVTPPSNVNSPPNISSAANAEVIENTSLAYTLRASDPNGDTLTYSVSGTDAGLFDISSSGALTFRESPNFELPKDANVDNVYNVILGVSDGKASNSIALALSVRNDKEGIRVRRIAKGLTDVTAIAKIPGSEDIFVTEKGGNIFQVNPVAETRVLERTIRNVNTAGEGGLLGLAVPPEYATSMNRYWVFVTAERTGFFGTSGSNITIREIRRDLPELPQGAASRLTIEHTTNVNYGGSMVFGSDGILTIGVGDAGNGDNAIDTSILLGKILRIRRNPDPFAGVTPIYLQPAPGNFMQSGSNQFIYKMGVQNPSIISFHDGAIFFGDRGSTIYEEINNVVLGHGSIEWGWPYREGTKILRQNGPIAPAQPVTQYPRGDGDREGSKVTSGYVYTGPAGNLVGKYIFADENNGKIWAVDQARLRQTSPFVAASQYELLNADFEPDVGTINGIVAFGQDASGNLYFADKDGEVFIVEST